MPFTLATPHQWLEEIKKSRFLVQASPITRIEEACHYIQEISDNTATHNCWAWKLGDQYRFNDDGEPSGTAGRPILSAIDGQQCDQLVVVVTRWFGGTKLGTGGLVRAYGGSTARCLQNAPLIEIIPRISYPIHCYYNEWPLLESRLAEFNAIIEQHSYDTEGIHITLAVPLRKSNYLHDFLANLTKGRIQLITQGT